MWEWGAWAYRFAKLAGRELAIRHDLVGHERSDFLNHVERYTVDCLDQSSADSFHTHSSARERVKDGTDK